MTKKSPAQLQREIDESLAKRYPYTMGKAGLWQHRVKETREQIARERAAAGMSPPYERFQIGDAVQFRWEPGTGGVIVRFESEPSEGRSWARVATPHGERQVPTDAIRKVRKEHEARVRRSVETTATSHATKSNAPKPDLTVRQINAIVRAADGRNIYLIRTRMGDETVQRITSARTKGHETEVRSLATGSWIPVLPERGDKLEVR